MRRRGLPMVVLRSGRSGSLLRRSVPAQTFLLLFGPMGVALLRLLDTSEEAFDAKLADNAYTLTVAALVIALLVVPVLCGWLISRGMRRWNERVRMTVAIVVTLLTAVVSPVVEWRTGLGSTLVSGLVEGVITLLVILLLVRIGAGAVLVWALRSAAGQVTVLGTLAARALPLLLLFVMFAFFTGELWQAADHLTRAQLWAVVGFLSLVGALFMATRLRDELSDLNATRVDPRKVLRGTPLAGSLDLVGETVPTKLSRGERVNVAVVLFLAQALQVVAFVILVFAFFLVFGKLMVQPEVVTEYVGRESPAGTLYGQELPVSRALLQVSLFLAVFSGLYFASSTSSDDSYRRAFFEPLLDEVAVGLAARDVYRARWADAHSEHATTLERDGTASVGTGRHEPGER
ncbi:hypothetical protein [Amycolatopsis suaedae]|uniref:hypothetical protein n=1 Tax=Amycolatopsis suaedae TaxID=2510978 RepID=UPI00196B4942|nr:hypothetical protein [Amycolatopsis suaedae]